MGLRTVQRRIRGDLGCHYIYKFLLENLSPSIPPVDIHIQSFLPANLVTLFLSHYRNIMLPKPLQLLSAACLIAPHICASASATSINSTVDLSDPMGEVNSTLLGSSAPLGSLLSQLQDAESYVMKAGVHGGLCGISVRLTEPVGNPAGQQSIKSLYLTYFDTQQRAFRVESDYGASQPWHVYATGEKTSAPPQYFFIAWIKRLSLVDALATANKETIVDYFNHVEVDRKPADLSPQYTFSRIVGAELKSCTVQVVTKAVACTTEQLKGERPDQLSSNKNSTGGIAVE